MTPWLLKLLVAGVLASLAAAQDFTEVPIRNWTECSAECDGGNRTVADNRKWLVPCHYFPCDFESKCPCDAMDIMLVVDRSNSIMEKNYWIVKQFIMDLAEALSRAQGPADTRFALVTFDKFLNVEFEFSDGYTLGELQEFQDKVWNLPYAPLEKGTVTADGLTEADAMLTRRPEPLNTQVVVVITDGRSTQKGLMDEAITLIHGDGSRIIFGIGIGNNVEYDDIYEMTLADDKTFMADDFTALSDIVSELSGDVCCEVAGINCTVVQDWSPCSVTCGTGVSTKAEECIITNGMGQVTSQETEYFTKECCANECVEDECSAASTASPPGMIHTFSDMSEFESRGIEFQQGQLSLQIDTDANVLRLYARVGGSWVPLCEACM